jgi:hypothetical protein
VQAFNCFIDAQAPLFSKGNNELTMRWSHRPDLLVRLKKYRNKTNRPYQAYQISGQDFMMDLAQPVYGIGNLLMAALFTLSSATTLCFEPIVITCRLS